MLWVPVLGAILLWVSPPAAALRTLQRGNSYKISPKPCTVNGLEGTCMFVWECIKTEGHHVGMCVDTFMFGSCCAHNATENVLLPQSSSEPAVLYVPPQSSQVANSSPYQLLPPTTTPITTTTTTTTITTQRSTAPPSDDMVQAAGSTMVGSWTSATGSWQASTEPAFVTRPRPPPPVRPRPTLRPRPTRRPINITSTTSSTTTTTTTSTTTTSTTTTSTTTTPKPTTTSSTTTTTTTTQPPTSATSTFVPPTSTMSTVSTSTVEKGVQCGIPPLFPRPETRIVGGRNAPFGGWPWQVSVRRTSFFGFSSTHRCGGAVLNENWIATAGHCVDDLLTSQIRIRVGEYDFSSVQEPYPFIERGVARKVVHPKYNFFTYEYDLALVQLESPLDFAPHIAPICLPASDDLLIGENATVTGWGRLSEGGTLPSVLQEVSVPIVSNDKCKSMFLRAGRHEYIPEIFLCAGFEGGGQDSCQGDSGGPLQVRGKDGHYFLAGIISWGIGCAEANLPGVCTRISKFVPWILENVT